jgi:DHA2 family multidrug resistance protein
VLTLSNFAIHRVELASLSSASSLYNMSRVLGGAVGTAILATVITTREQLHFARIGDAVSLFSAAARDRIEHLTGAFLALDGDRSQAAHQATAAVGRVVRRDAFVMAYNDCFFVLGCMLLLAIGVIWLADRVLAGEK